MRLAPASMTILMWAHSYTCVFHSASPMRNMHCFKGIIKFPLLKLLSVKDCEGWWLSGGCIRAWAAQDWSCGFGLLAGGVREGRMRRVWGRKVGGWGGPCKSCLVCIYNLKSRKLTGYPVYKNWEVPLSFCLQLSQTLNGNTCNKLSGTSPQNLWPCGKYSLSVSYPLKEMSVVSAINILPVWLHFLLVKILGEQWTFSLLSNWESALPWRPAHDRDVLLLLSATPEALFVDNKPLRPRYTSLRGVPLLYKGCMFTLQHRKLLRTTLSHLEMREISRRKIRGKRKAGSNSESNPGLELPVLCHWSMATELRQLDKHQPS